MIATKEINMGTLNYNTISYDTISYDVIRRNNPQRNAAKKRAAIRRRRARRVRTNILIALIIVAIFAGMGAVFFTTYAKATDSVVEKYYTQIMVEEGDSLWSIAMEYMPADYDDINDYIKEIKRLNHISGDIVMAGYTLTVIAQR